MSVEITLEIVEQHGLTQEEYERILKVLGRTPNLTELGIFSVLWSEHCSYKSSKVHLRKFPTKGEQVLQGPGENAGVIDLGDGWGLVFKMESHNHPSFIEPYQGAATGVGGILRDVFTMGARPIALLDSLRFGSPDHPKTKFLVGGVVAGIAGYGNCMGIPTVGGETYFDSCYNQNNLVNAMCVGLVKKDRIFKGIAAGVGNPLIYVGSKTGRDGIHGATMASESFDDKSQEKRPTVQVGDPFTEKLLLEACLELMQKEYLVGIQDMGAAGLTSSSFEMASRAGTGLEMDLDQVPVREEGMSAYELMLSESQERMLCVVTKGCESDAIEIFKKWDLDAAVVGRVIEEQRVKIRHRGKAVADLPIAPLVSQAPVYERPIREPKYFSEINHLDLNSISLPQISPSPRPSPTRGEGEKGKAPTPLMGGGQGEGGPGDFNRVLERLIGGPNLSSRRWIWRQYDHMVMLGTVVLPGSDAAVLRIPGSRRGVAVTTDCNSTYCYLNPREGAKIAVAEAARNLVCSGARPLAITDCLNFGSPENPEVMWQFKEAVEGISEACLALNTPVTGGNVSFYNETKGEAIFPTPTIGMVGVLDDLSQRTTPFFKKEGDLILLVGETREELGGSTYLKELHQKLKGPIPTIDLQREKSTHDFVLHAIRKGLIQSAHDLSEGGLALSLAECSICGANPLGAQVKLEASFRPDALLFGESQGRILLSAKGENREAILALAKEYNVPVAPIGKVGGSRLEISPWIDLDIVSLKKLWEEGFEKNLKLGGARR